jgi:hypothetical protein
VIGWLARGRRRLNGGGWLIEESVLFMASFVTALIRLIFNCHQERRQDLQALLIFHWDVRISREFVFSSISSSVSTIILLGSKGRFGVGGRGVIAASLAEASQDADKAVSD